MVEGNFKLPQSIFHLYFVTLILIAFVLPLLFHFSLFLQRGVLYFYFLEEPEEACLRKAPHTCGIANARNFYIQNREIVLGVWHLLPYSLTINNETRSADQEESLNNGLPIILYIHGNVGSRARPDRLRFYQTLQTLNFHVITFDYRCFGDSTYSTPHEEAVVSDCLAVARWLIKISGQSPIYFYGHSLGTGMTTHMATKLRREGFEANGIILEAPFTDMPSEIQLHPFGTIFRVFPWYNYLFSTPYHKNGEKYDSASHILNLTSPIMILHAADDGTIPCVLGQKLYEHGVRKRPKGSGRMSIHIYEAERGYGHTGLTTAPETPALIREFVEATNIKL